jgi:large subunit ribosomal protein L19
MALLLKHKETTFGVGDKVKVIQKIKEASKERLQAFDGMVIAIKGRGMGKSFTVRRIGVHKIGIERIFPLFSPNIEKVEIIREGVKGVRSAKLYFTRFKSKKEIEKIYSRAQKRVNISTDENLAKKSKPKTYSPKKLSDKQS